MKTILVTGANKGIGYGIVRKLLRDYSDTCLLLGSRDVQRGENAVKTLIEELGMFRTAATKNTFIYFKVLSTRKDWR